MRPTKLHFSYGLLCALSLSLINQMACGDDSEGGGVSSTSATSTDSGSVTGSGGTSESGDGTETGTATSNSSSTTTTTTTSATTGTSSSSCSSTDSNGMDCGDDDDDDDDDSTTPGDDDDDDTTTNTTTSTTTSSHLDDEDDDDDDDTSTGTGTGTSDDDDDSSGTGDDDDDDDDTVCDETCADGVDPTVVYLLTHNEYVVKYRTGMPLVTVGRLDQVSCAALGTPFSMAVSRTGYALIVDEKGAAFGVNLTAEGLECTTIPYEPWKVQAPDLGITDDRITPTIAIDQNGCEELYVHSYKNSTSGVSTGGLLARVNKVGPLPTPNFTFELIRETPYGQAELSGNDEHGLELVSVVSPGSSDSVHVALDMPSGTNDVVTVLSESVKSKYSYAFAHINDEQLVFFDTGLQASTVYDVAHPELEGAEFPFRVVGADVAHCEIKP